MSKTTITRLSNNYLLLIIIKENVSLVFSNDFFLLISISELSDLLMSTSGAWYLQTRCMPGHKHFNPANVKYLKKRKSSSRKSLKIFLKSKKQFAFLVML